MVVVGYRRYDVLRRALVSLERSEAVINEVIVIDNESDREQLRKLAARFPRFEFVANIDNDGFAMAANQGFSRISSECVLFLNPDIELGITTVASAITELVRDRDIGIVTCRLNLPDGRLDHACKRGIPTPAASIAFLLRLHRFVPRSHWAGRYTMSWLDDAGDHDVEACSGAFMLMWARTFRIAGGWDEGYRFYAEDLDLCLRVRELGYRIRYLGHAVAVHHKSATSYLRVRGHLTPGQLEIRARVKREIVASHLRFFSKNQAASQPWLVRDLIYVWFAMSALWVRARYRT